MRDLICNVIHYCA